MKRTIIIFVMLLAGCGGPRVIPDDKLRQITRDIYLANAYTSSRGVRVDSLEIYEPLFARYGYTLADFRHTLANFSRRKSSRLSDIISATHDELDRQYKFYQKRVATLERIDSIAGALFSSVVRRDSVLHIKRLSDTSKLTVRLPLEAGRYTVTYNILIDSADHNYGQRTTVSTADSLGRWSVINTQWLERQRRLKRELSFDVTPGQRRMRLRIADFSNPSAAPVDIRIDSLVIVHYLPKAASLDSMNRRLWGHKFVIDETAPDSLAAPLLPRGAVEGEGVDAR